MRTWNAGRTYPGRVLPAPDPLIVLSDPSDRSDLTARAQELATRLGLPHCTAGAPLVGLALAVTPRGLELRPLERHGPGPVQPEFVVGAFGHRRRQGFRRGEPLARAMGVHRHGPVHVLDATPGLGRDTFLLASLGCRVTAVERQPVMRELLADALARAQAHGDLAGVVARIELVCADARDVLAAGDVADVVLLDPMFPGRRGSALVRKEMRVLRRLVGDDPDAAELLAAALDAAPGRVVVRRPTGAPVIPSTRRPGHVVEGRRTRFDVYLIGARDDG